MPTEQLDVAILGCGHMGRTHAGNIARDGRARLRLLVDPRRTAAEQLHAELGADAGEARIAASADEASADPAIGLVSWARR